MSQKARDGQGRWRSKTIAFRISPEEDTLLKDLVRLSGFTKQDYIIHRVLNREVKVYPNPRVQKALRDTMKQLCEQLNDFKSSNELTKETLCVLDFMGRIYDGLREAEKKEVN